MRTVVALTLGAATGLALSAALGYVWLVWGGEHDPLLSW